MRAFSPSRRQKWIERKQQQAQAREQYRKSPTAKFVRAQAAARRRGVPWELTFNQWLNLWEDSGHCNADGPNTTQYRLVRFNDTGAFRMGNAVVIPVLKIERQRERCAMAAELYQDEEWAYVHLAPGVEGAGE